MPAMLWPNGTLTRPSVTSPYGMRTHPITGERTLHAGTDMTGYQLVRAIAPGTVVAVGTPRGWSAGGIQVWIQHDGFLTRSMHLKSTAVNVGDIIPEGRILGVMGMTGGATGVHHHLEVVVNGVQVDPVPFITARLDATAGGAARPTPPTPDPQEDDMRIFSTTDKTFYLGKPGGIVAIKGIPDLQLLRRFLASPLGNEVQFNEAERDIIRYYLITNQ